MQPLSRKLALLAIDRIELQLRRRLTRSFKQPIARLTSFIRRDLDKIELFRDRFRGLFEPFARKLFNSRVALFLAAAYVTSLEDPNRLELQAQTVSVLFNLSPSEAIRFLSSKRVLTREEFDKLSELERQFAFTVAQVSEERLLEEIQTQIVDGLKSGTPRAELEKNLLTLVPKLTQSRIELIAHQNLRIAAMQGRFEQMHKVKDALPFIQWKTIGDDRVRQEHVVLHNQIWPLDRVPFWPPLGFNCRCWTIQLSERRIPRGKKVISGPGVYPAVQGPPLVILGNPEDVSTYSMNNAIISFDLARKPLPLSELESIPLGR